MSSQPPPASDQTRPETSTSGAEIPEEPRESCVKYFDALWFCYSPVYQMKQYYVYGTVDDCTGHWGKFMDCLKKKTVRYKDDVPADGSEGKHPIWQLRTQEEATEFWTAEFDRRAKEPGAPGVGGDGSEGHQTTMI